VLKRLLTDGLHSVGMVERHRDAGPVVIDIDLRYAANTNDFHGGPDAAPDRRFDLSYVRDFMHVYITVLSRWVVLPPRGHGGHDAQPKPPGGWRGGSSRTGCT